MHAIVIDTEKTAREYIKFMKEQHFLFLSASPLDERLKAMKESDISKCLLM